MPKGEAIDETEAVDVWTTNTTYKGRSVAYKDIAFKVPDGGKTPTDEEYTYTANDMSVGDLDGDGEYEILLRRVPSMDVNTRTSYPVIEACKTDGTHMWTIDIGPNEINEVDINFLAYDMDGDGKQKL